MASRFMQSRREWLSGLMVASAAVPLVGCFPKSAASDVGEDAGPQAGGANGGATGGALPEAAAEDVGALVTIYTMEDLAVFAYRAVADALSPGLRDVALLFADHHDAHQDAARASLERLGVPLPPLPETYTLPAVMTERDILLAALTLEVQAVNAYIGILATTVDPAIRIEAANTYASEVAHVVALRGALNDAGAVNFAFARDLGPALAALKAAPPPEEPSP